MPSPSARANSARMVSSAWLYPAMSGKGTLRPRFDLSNEPLRSSRPLLANPPQHPGFVRDRVGCEVLDRPFELVCEFLQGDAARCRVGAFELCLEGRQLSPSDGKVLRPEALLYLLATVLDACKVGFAGGISIKAFSGLLKRWTCAHIIVQLLTFADVFCL